jgi:hypothetical protein
MFKDFHSGRELQDEQGRKGYIIAARSQELVSLKAPTYLVGTLISKLCQERGLSRNPKNVIRLVCVPDHTLISLQ